MNLSTYLRRFLIDNGNPQNFSFQKKAKKIRNFEFLLRFGQDPDPDPGFSFSVGSGSGSIKKFPGSETLVYRGPRNGKK